MSADDPSTTNPTPRDPAAEVIAFLKDRSHPCPRCAYDLRNIQSARCPECGEPLILKIGTPRARFGWLIIAMAPGCFSGVAAMFLLVPIFGALWNRAHIGPGGLPVPVLGADAFGFTSAASVVLMYRYRHRIMAWKPRRQATFAIGVWFTHVLAFVIFLLGLWYWH